MTLEELLRQGKSFGQGASNAAASTVTGPVDMLAWLLRKGGVDVGDTPIGGEAWMRQKGLMATPENKLAGLLGEGLGLAAPIVAAAKAPEIAGGLLQMGRNLATPQTMNKQTGAIVYHGSPHKFDKFDSSKIGTGEGAQAYGHGLYLAESPDVAGQYQKMLSGKKAADGSALNWDNPAEVAAMRLHQFGGDKDKAIQWITTGKVDGHNAAAGLPNPAISAANKRAHDFGQQVIAEIKAGPKVAVDSGQLYKVDLPDEHIAKMLDWDKPLSQQHPDVRSAVQKVVPPFNDDMVNVITKKIEDASLLARTATDAATKKAAAQEHARLLNSLRTRQPEVEGKALMSYLGSPVQASEALRNAGIPGIRYLDGGSRSAGAGSSNFVVFPGNEGLLKILERNGSKP